MTPVERESSGAMVIPANLGELRRVLVDRHARSARVGSIDLAGMQRVIAHRPEDMTVTVEAGITLGALNRHLAQGGQWLPLDPPQPKNLTVGALITHNSSGPRRYGYGTVREHLLQLAVVLADGRLIRSGARVVKSVAGYDLHKLFVGSRGTLGVVVEATFKLQPRPETERFIRARCDTTEQAGATLEAVVRSSLRPIVIDLCRSAASGEAICSLILGFAGSQEAVEEQVARARELGVIEPGDLEDEDAFWAEPGPVRRRSVLPSKTIEAIGELGDVAFIARAGNGVVYYRGGSEPLPPEVPGALMKRVKDAFDPRGVFPVWPGFAQ